MVAQISIQTPAGLKTITVMRAMHLGTLRTIRTAKVMIAGTLRQVAAFSPLSASPSISPVAGQAFFNSPTPIETERVTCEVSGGFGPFTYSWTRDSGDALQVSNASPASTSFYYASVAVGEFYAALFRCRVTDSVGQTADLYVTATVQNFGGFG